MSRIVVALGGNALGKSAKEQLSLVKNTAKSIVNLIKKGHEVIITHGNGPQVGMINLAFEKANTDMPFPECGAMSQGYIGYHLQNALYSELANENINKQVITIVTQVVVNKEDKAFTNPTKPIGQFYSKEEAEKIASEQGYVFKEDAGRGYRRVVASPKPVDVIEKDVIKTLLDNNYVVITVGGGGIPVVKQANELIGVPAVIDKDYASAKVAELLNADYLFILTAVDKVAINYNKPNEVVIDKLTVSEAEKYIAEKQFAEGSMLPKVEAALMFVRSKENKKAVIASLEKAGDALEGLSGTVITM